MSRFCRLSLANAVVLATAAPAAVAARSAPVSGTFAADIDETSVVARPVGSRCIVSLTATFAFSGDLDGQFTAPFDITHYGACNEPARETFIARGEFTGTVAGVRGSFRFVFRGTIDAQGSAHGRLTITSASGGLKGLTGMVELSGQTNVGGTYSGTLRL
jgi:hypothetical protein